MAEAARSAAAQWLRCHPPRSAAGLERDQPLVHIMTNTRLPIAVCAAVAEVLDGSHQTLDALFEEAGAPGPPPALAHHSKWKTWLRRAGDDANVDSLAVLGRLIEEFMDLPPSPAPETSDFEIEHDPVAEYNQKRTRLNAVLEEYGFRYFRGGRVIPIGEVQPEPTPVTRTPDTVASPSDIEELLQRLIRGLPRAMHPLAYRRKNARSLLFESEHDIQDLLHSQLRPWVADIRPEEFTPSYAGSSTRMDFLLPAHSLVIEVKRVRDKAHAAKVGQELILDIDHYHRHPDCNRLWCAVYDPHMFIKNPAGVVSDLERGRSARDGLFSVRVLVVPGAA